SRPGRASPPPVTGSSTTSGSPSRWPPTTSPRRSTGWRARPATWTPPGSGASVRQTHAAVRGEHLADHPHTLVRGQPAEEAGRVLGAAGAPERRRGHDRLDLAEIPVGALRVEVAGVHRAGVDRVEDDAALEELRRNRHRGAR